MHDWLRVGKIGFEARGVSAGGQCNRSVRRVRAIVCADGVLVHEVGGGSNDGTAFGGFRSTPHAGDGMNIELPRVAGKHDGFN